MTGESRSVDYWRKLFQCAKSSIFEVIEQAIVVAEADFPEEFRSRRNQIVEKLFSSELSRVFGCDDEELQAPIDGEKSGEAERGVSVKMGVGEKGSTVDTSNGETEKLRGSHMRWVRKEGQWIAAMDLGEPKDKTNESEEAALRAKMELTKRKLHEGYQRAENAKKQRTTKVLEVLSLSKEEIDSAWDNKPKIKKPKKQPKKEPKKQPENRPKKYCPH